MFEPTFHLVEAEIPEGWKIAKALQKKKYILTDSEGTEHYVKMKMKSAEMAKEFKEKDILEIIQEYKTSNALPKTAKGKKEKRIKGEIKEIKKSKKAQREENKEKELAIEAKILEQQEVALKCMNMKLKRGSAEHIALRERLYEIKDELRELGHKDFYARQTEVSDEDIKKAQKDAMTSKREKRMKKGRNVRDTK